MAPHDDDRSVPLDDELSSLYQQRKRRHPAPERLNKTLLATTKADPSGHGRGYGWKSAASSAAAAVVIVILGVNWLQEPKLTISESASPASEMADTTVTESEMSARDSLTEAPKSLAAPAPEADARRSEPAPSSLPRSVVPAPMADKALQFEALQAEPVASAPRFLKAIEGEAKLYEQCDGSLFQHEIPDAPDTGWFEVDWTQEGGIRQITPIGDESQCLEP
ncbi:MAG: hypothetical protein LAT65_16845 [Saccharospirillum sp.]|nr:hypothetical protein [Saccharospirillum sp.]